jgi:hypothetical protein
MGACEFTNHIKKSETVDTAGKAYDVLREEAIYEYGNDPYSGTIATTDGFAVKPLKAGETIDEWYTRAEDNQQKWGPCWCVLHDDTFIFSGLAAC